MKIKTVPQHAADKTVRAEIVYPLSQCEAEPLAAGYAPKFVELLVKWGVVHAKHLDLEDNTAKAQARVDRSFTRMGRVADRVSAELLLLIDGNRSHATYTHFFSDKSVSVFKKSKQLAQLSIMHGWVKSLNDSGRPTLQAIVPDLTAALKETDEALAFKVAVELEKSQFRDIGERKEFIDEVNAVRKSVHGELGKLPHKVDGLPNDFADRFFRPDSSQDDEDEEEAPTIESVSEQIEALNQELSDTQALLEELKAKKLEEEKAAEALEADKAALAQLQKNIAEQERLATKLRAKIESA